MEVYGMISFRKSHAKPWLFSLIPFEHHQATARQKHHSIILRLQSGHRSSHCHCFLIA
nr:MAG TPA: hypothetical protein [Caudoviricetes sp.]